MEERKGLLGASYQEYGVEVSETTFNLEIGGLLAYSFLMNIALMSAFFRFATSVNFVALIIGYFACVIVGNLITNSSENPVIAFIGYNLVSVPVGVLLSVIMMAYADQPDLVKNAMILTAVITVGMIAASILIPGAFAGLGKALGISLLVVILVELVCVIARIGFGPIDYIVAGIFALYIGYDWYKASMLTRTTTNAIRVALNLYLDIVNLFIRILRILGSRRR